MNFDVAGLELAKMVLKLYKSGRYRSFAGVLAEKTLNLGTDAGAYVGMVENYGDMTGRSLATDRALRELDKLAFTLYIMRGEGIYTEEQVAPVLSFAREIKDGLSSDLRRFVGSAAPESPVYDVHTETAVAIDDGNEQISIDQIMPESDGLDDEV